VINSSREDEIALLVYEKRHLVMEFPREHNKLFTRLSKGYNSDPYVIDQPCLTNLFMRGKVMGSFYKIVPLHDPPKLLTGNLFANGMFVVQEFGEKGFCIREG
jgi:hypothetical protein